MNGLNNPIGYKSTEPLQKPFIMNPFRFGGEVGGWVELGRTTLGGNSKYITVSGLADKIYLHALGHCINTGYAAISTQVGNSTADTATNYANRRNINGGTDSTSINRTSMNVTQSDQNSIFASTYISNVSNQEKLTIDHAVNQNNAGAASVPIREQNVNKWSNTSNVIDILRYFNGAGGNYTTGSEIVVLGWDPDDTSSSNFWEELASVDVTTGTTISTGDFTAKKYLMIQHYIASSAISYDWQFNASTDTQTSTYSGRHNSNGTEYTQTNKNVLLENMGFGAHPHSGVMFVINNSSNEKLVMGNIVSEGTSTAGFAPNRTDMSYKWTNTTNQINNITMLNSTNLDRFVMKVWGHD